LPYASITDEHARRFKADLLTDDRLTNATLQKLWAMLRALAWRLTVACWTPTHSRG